MIEVGDVFAKPDKIYDFQDAERVDDEERDKPPFLAAACSMPKRKAFQYDSPSECCEKKREKDVGKSRHKRGIDRGKCVHIRASYHTLHEMRYLGVDYGSSKIGLALSDEAGTMGFPHSVVANTPRFVDDVCKLIAKENVGAVVIGESRNLAGGENAIAKDARAFGSQVAVQAGVPAFYESEVFTSAEARRAPEKELKSRAAKRRVNVDASAAALILTSYLSHTSHG